MCHRSRIPRPLIDQHLFSLRNFSIAIVDKEPVHFLCGSADCLTPFPALLPGVASISALIKKFHFSHSVRRVEKRLADPANQMVFRAAFNWLHGSMALLGANPDEAHLHSFQSVGRNARDKNRARNNPAVMRGISHENPWLAESLSV